MTSKTSCGVRRQKTQSPGFAVTKRFTTLVWLPKIPPFCPPSPGVPLQRRNRRIQVKNGTLGLTRFWSLFSLPLGWPKGRRRPPIHRKASFQGPWRHLVRVRCQKPSGPIFPLRSVSRHRLDSENLTIPPPTRGPLQRGKQRIEVKNGSLG